MTEREREKRERERERERDRQTDRQRDRDRHTERDKERQRQRKPQDLIISKRRGVYRVLMKREELQTVKNQQQKTETKVNESLCTNPGDGVVTEVHPAEVDAAL